MGHVKKLESERQNRYYRDRNSRDRWGSNLNLLRPNDQPLQIG